MFLVTFIRDDLRRKPRAFDTEEAAVAVIARTFGCDVDQLVCWDGLDGEALYAPADDDGEGLVCQLDEADDA